MMKYSMITPLVAAALVWAAPSAFAAVSAEEAAKLKSELTPLGGQKAGNADGSIPAWDGGYTKAPSGWKAGDPRPDPFAGEKPLYTVTPENVGQYAALLTDGQQALFKKYPDYRINVYPTHRTAAAPAYIYENTFKNATSAKSSADGDSIQGAYGGTPFPIPKTGAEVMWNHQLRWLGESILYRINSYVVSGDSVVLASTTRNEMNFPYHFKDGSLDKFNGEYWQLYQVTTAPAYKAGETILVRDSLDFEGKGRQAWQYLVGQRRVRKAPSIAYDTPNNVTSGADFFDEVSLFLGAMDRYDWKLVEKKEMLVPYNTNRTFLPAVGEVLKPGHLNPEHVRFEKHRVWVVEATLRSGKRHVIPKRRFYVDEDSWIAVLYDGWDAQGQLWHTGMSMPFLAPEIPGLMAHPFVMMDVLKGSYSATVLNEGGQWTSVPRWPEDNFTPESMAARGVR